VSPELLILLADAVLAMHAGFIAFVVVGQAAILVGIALRWRWVRGLWFRVLHLGAIGFVVLQAWLGVMCPLTVLEGSLRRAAGQAGYDELGFIATWLRRLIFFQAEPWVFTTAYTAFGALVVWTWWVAPPRRRRRSLGRTLRPPS